MPLPYETSEFILVENGTAWSFCNPADPAPLLDSITEAQFECDRFLPYWAELWPSAEVLFALPALGTLPRPAAICDLGCGLGVISARLRKLGCNVVSIDISPEACVYARANILRHAPRAHVACADWRRPPLKHAFDIVVAADVLYEDQCLEPVVRFLCRWVTPHGRAIIADPCRAQWEGFKQRIAQKDFAVEKLHREEINGGKTTVEVLCLRRGDA